MLLTLVSLLLAACGSVATPQASATQLPVTPTNTVIGTWETEITGTVYGGASGRSEPLAGATVRYVVEFSFFPELQADRLNTTQTDENGEFSLRVMVHDTDSVQIVVEAPGFAPYEESLTGFDLVGSRRTIEVELAPA